MRSARLHFFQSATRSRPANTPSRPVDIRVVEAHGVELVPHQTQPTIGHTANLHLVASLLHMTKPCEWNDTTLRQHSVFENPPNQPTACSTYRPDPVSVYKSTRPN